MIEKSMESNKHTCPKLVPVIDEFLVKLKAFESQLGSEYIDSFNRIELKKGEYLFRSGKIAKDIWILDQGIARATVEHDGKEDTIELYIGTEIIELYSSSTLRIPSIFNIQMLTDAVVYSISWQKINQLKECNPIVHEIEKLMIACHVHYLDNRLLEFQTLSAKDRLENLRKNRPDVMKHIKRSVLASYLGIEIETLSRISKPGGNHKSY
jgi:cAMP-binding proteins - catabolite gene activator and regulatory subunit of cAMP-dependent protein kinases